MCSVGIGKVEEALPFFKRALEANPDITQYWLSYIDGLIKLDRMVDANSVFDKAKSRGMEGDGFAQIEKQLAWSEDKNTNTLDPSKDTLQSLINLYKKGQFQRVIIEVERQILEFQRCNFV